MRRRTILALTIGVAAVAAAVVRAGAGAVAQALESLHLSGLAMLALETGVVLITLNYRFAPPLEAMGRELRAPAER